MKKGDFDLYRMYVKLMKSEVSPSALQKVISNVKKFKVTVLCGMLSHNQIVWIMKNFDHYIDEVLKMDYVCEHPIVQTRMMYQIVKQLDMVEFRDTHYIVNGMSPTSLQTIHAFCMASNHMKDICFLDYDGKNFKIHKDKSIAVMFDKFNEEYDITEKYCELLKGCK